MKLNRDYSDLKYQEGFGNECATEALEGALPKRLNAPQTCKYGLYTEQISGTAFTIPRCKNQRAWQYRILPSVAHNNMTAIKGETFKNVVNDFFDKSKVEIFPNQTRWKALSFPSETESKTFIEGLVTVCGAGETSLKNGIAIYTYAANKSMENEAFYSSDGDFLIVPQTGKLYITTEFGKMVVEPLEICVIQRGIRFSIDIIEPVRGWVAEIFKGHFQLPDLGPIGANGLANPRDFKTPVAFYEKINAEFKIINKFQGEFFQFTQNHSCFDVVAWHGNYAPYKYCLLDFCPMNTVKFDHADPSIFTVLTCASDEPGVAVCDFVIFPGRFLVAENTFRPPYYHRNTMSEYMGVIGGVYEAKPDGFLPGGSSLHLPMTSHGPEAAVFDKASTSELKPVRIPDTDLAFMFESHFLLKVTKVACDDVMFIDHNYMDCWKGLKDNFSK